jgi:TonB family protein
MATNHNLGRPALLFALLVGFYATTVSECSETIPPVSVLVHSRVGAKPCELVQRGSLVIAKQYAWVQIEGQKSETYSPEMGPDDYLSAPASTSGQVKKETHKSGFELKAELEIPAGLPAVRALDGSACADLQSAISEVERAREQRRAELQRKLYRPGVDGVVPPIPVNDKSAKPDQTSTAISDNGISISSQTRFTGTVALVILIDVEGKVQQSRVTRSVNPELDKKAAEEVARWTFAPARKKGLPVPTVVPIEITFTPH